MKQLNGAFNVSQEITLRRATVVSVLAAVLTFCAPMVAAASGTFNVREHGAAGDGKTLDTAAINKAVAACAAAGGGQVLFPPGVYLSGTVHLTSNTTLFFDAGSRLVGAPTLDGYQNFTPPAEAPEARFPARWHRALILGVGVADVAIAGPGVIDGNKVFDPQGEGKMRGPHAILLGNSRNVAIRDVSIVDAANYAVMLEYCRQVDIRNVKISGGWDGVHFRGWPGSPCRDVSITGCRFFTGDDSIAGRYWENVLISGCVVNSSCNGIRLLGPADNLIIHDCLFYGPGVHAHGASNRRNMLAGINLQPGAWDATTGALDNVLISDIVMHNVAAPFHFTMKRGNTAGRIAVSRVAADGVYRAASSVESWTESPFTDVSFRDVQIEYGGGGEYVVGGKPEQARLPVKSPGVDPRPLPAWGFYARNVKNLRFENVRLSCAGEEGRPAVLCEGVERLALDNFRFSFSATLNAADPFVLSNVGEIHLRDAGFPLLEPRRTELNLIPDDPGGRFVAGKPFSAKATVENGDEEGLGRIDLAVAGQKATRWAWLRRDEKKEIVFEGLIAPAAGSLEVRSGNLVQTVTVEPSGLSEKP